MRSNKTGWLMLAPTLVILATFGIMPFFYVLYVAFHQWNPFGASSEMVYNGAKNFRRLVFDKEFLLSVGLTLKFAFFAVGSEVVLGYFLAQLLMKDFPGKAIFRTIHTLPLIVAPIVVGSVWRLMTTPSIGIILAMRSTFDRSARTAIVRPMPVESPVPITSQRTLFRMAVSMSGFVKAYT